MTASVRFAAYRGIALRLVNSGAQGVTSDALGMPLRINPTQVRRDLATIGITGRRGVGYRPTAIVAGVDVALAGREPEVRRDVTALRKMVEAAEYGIAP